MTDDKAPPPLGLERFAEAYAYLREYPPEDRQTLLTALQVDEASFVAAQSYWGREFANGITRGDATFVLSFARVYGRVEYKARVRGRPADAVRSEVEAPTASAEARIAPRQMRPLRTPIERTESPAVGAKSEGNPANVALATYMLGEAMAVTADETALVDGRKVADALRNRGIPFDAAAPVVAPAAVPLADEQSGETAIADGSAVRAALVARGILAPSDIAGTPFAQASPPLPFERFVHYRRELSRGRRFDEIATSMGLTPASLASGEGYWRSRLEADAEVRTAFEALWNAPGRQR